MMGGKAFSVLMRQRRSKHPNTLNHHSVSARGCPTMDASKGGTSAGRVVGFIRPPPDVRAIVDKTAQFVAKAGADFESKIAEREAGNLKFAFLRPDNPYHSYYKHKVEELATGKAMPAAPPPTAAATGADSLEAATAGAPASTENGAAPAGAAAPPLPPSAEASSVRRVAVANPLNAALKTARELIAAGVVPERDEFTIPTPSFGAGELIDAMKLTAQVRALVLVPRPRGVPPLLLPPQFTAVNGRGFLATLTSREMRNPLFDFLKPSASGAGGGRGAAVTAGCDLSCRACLPLQRTPSSPTSRPSSTRTRASSRCERSLRLSPFTLPPHLQTLSLCSAPRPSSTA